MGKHTKSRGFSQFKGLTIESVDATAVNNVNFTFTNGQTVSINCDNQVIGIGVIQAEKIQGFAATHEVIAEGTGDYPHRYKIGQKVARIEGSKDKDGDFLYEESEGGTQWLKKIHVKKLK
jgi:hypothetical protein